ncbi:putative RING-type domain-containing protein [Seiridium unicorne]|uniref:RING-type domain-containing protein n=1 Tax=Seiridium unicorne TaxID=138068 RepID=A0ABR2V308_9PEZI
MEFKLNENLLEENLISNLLVYFDERGVLCDDITCKVDCPICSTKLAILQAPDDDHESWCVLACCGHIYGYQCITSWIETASEPSCPQCRKPLQHRRCLHKYSAQEVTFTKNFNIHKDVVKVRPRGDLSRDCKDCSLERNGQRSGTNQFSEVSYSENGVYERVPGVRYAEYPVLDGMRYSYTAHRQF